MRYSDDIKEIYIGYSAAIEQLQLWSELNYF